MNLIENMMEPCILMDKTRTPDGEGGFIPTWTEGAEFTAAITRDSTMQARIAEKEGVTSVYTITTHRNTVLEFHDVLKRVSDGKTFRVTSEGKEMRSPLASNLDMSQVTAEGWELT